MSRKPRGYWTFERIKEDAAKYKSRYEWQRNSGSAYSAARRKCLMDDSMITGHFQVLRKKRTKEECLEVAKKYIQKSDFEKGNMAVYSYARYHGWLDEVCSHMKPGINCNHTDYLYKIFFTDGHYYIGRSFTPGHRYERHINHPKEAVFQHMKKHTTERPSIIILKKFNNQRKCILAEHKIINTWIDDPMCLNRSKNKQGVFKMKYTDDELFEKGSRYSSRKQWELDAPSEYRAAKKRGLLSLGGALNKIIPSKVKPPNPYRTPEGLKKAMDLAKRHNNASMRKTHQAAWQALYHAGLLDECFPDRRPKKPNGYWHNENATMVAIKAAQNEMNRSSLRKNNYSAWKVLHKEGLLDECFPKKGKSHGNN